MEIRRYVMLLCWSILGSACQRPSPPIDWSQEGEPPTAFTFTSDARIPCWLKLNREERPVIRVNCFAVDGDLYTHSNRFVPLANLIGNSWTSRVEADGPIRVAVEGYVYEVVARRVRSEDQRVKMLKDRGYSYVPDAIQVYELVIEDPL